MRAGLAEGVLPCDYFPPKLPVRKDIMQVFVCENHNPKIRTKRPPIVRPSAPSPFPPGFQPQGMTVIPIRNREDMKNFLRKILGLR